MLLSAAMPQQLRKTGNAETMSSRFTCAIPNWQPSPGYALSFALKSRCLSRNAPCGSIGLGQKAGPSFGAIGDDATPRAHSFAIVPATRGICGGGKVLRPEQKDQREAKAS